MSSSVDHVTLRCAGAYSGVVEVQLSDTVGALRDSLARLIGSQTIKIIASGVILSDDTRRLDSYKLTHASRLLVTRGEAAAMSVQSAESAAREARLQRIRAAALRLATHDFDSSSFNVALEAQNGSSCSFSESAQRAIITAMVLHAHGRKMLAARDYPEAASALELAMQAFEEAPEETVLLDNPPQAALDWCWAVFLAQDLTQLQQGTRRLQAAREGLARSHGADLGRLRTLVDSEFAPSQLLSYVRLHILEAAVAFHRGDVQSASESLDAAREAARPFHVDADVHAQFVAMGFTPQEATRGLRHCSGALSQGVEWVLAQRSVAAERQRRHREERRELRRLRAFGKTSSGKLVDGATLQRLTSLDYPEDVAAQALCEANNNFEAALDSLVNTARLEALQNMVIRKRKRQTGLASRASLVEMGFSISQVDAALKQTDFDAAAATELLLSGDVGESGMDVLPSSAGAAGAERNPEEAALSRDDWDAEAELARELEDPLADYDVDISEENAVLADYQTRIRDGHRQACELQAKVNPPRNE